MDFLCGGDDLVQVAYDGIALGLGYANNGFDEARAEEERFPTVILD